MMVWLGLHQARVSNWGEATDGSNRAGNDGIRSGMGGEGCHGEEGKAKINEVGQGKITSKYLWMSIGRVHVD